MRKNQLRACIMSGLVCGVMMGVMGLTTTPVQAATYEDELMADVSDGDLESSSAAYTYGHVMSYDNKNQAVIYDFRGEDVTEISGHAVSSISVMPGCNANVRANMLKLKSDIDDFSLAGGGVMINDKGRLDLNAKDILVSSNMEKQYPNHGIAMAHTGMDEGGKGILNVNGEVIIKKNIDGDVGVLKQSFSNSPDYGITREKNYWGYDDSYKGGRWLPTGVFGGLSAGSVMNFNVPVYVAVKGTAIQSDPYYKWQGIADYDLMTVNINKGGYILTPIDKNMVSYSTANFGGTININVPEVNGKRVLGDSPVYMVGNAIVMKDDGRGGKYFFRNGRTNIALTTPDSYWRGAIDNTGAAQVGELNLYIQNGAKWICEQVGALNGMRGDEMPEVESKGHYGNYDGIHHVNFLIGGDTEASAGILQQEDARPITVSYYAGHMKVLYSDPNGDNTFANRGSLTIDQAQKESEIVIMPMGYVNGTTVERILGGKVIYKGGNNHLSKKVYVGEGMLRSAQIYSNVFMVENRETINTDENAFFNSYVKAVKGNNQYVKGYISGDSEKDSAWIKEKVSKGNGNYEFIEDTSLIAEDEKNFAVEVVKDIHISAKDKKLYVAVEKSKNKLIRGLSNYVPGGKLTIDAKEIHILSANTTSGRTESIGMNSSKKEKKTEVILNGNVYVNSINESGYLLGVYASGNSHLVINGDFTMIGPDEKHPWGLTYKRERKVNPAVQGGIEYGANGLYAGSDYGIQQGPYIEVNRNVHIKGKGEGVFANGGGSRIDIIGGGYIEVEHSTHPYFALLAQSGIVHINTNKEGTVPNNNKLVIKGDIGVMPGSVHSNEPFKISEVVLALTTSDSSLTGKIFNGFKPMHINKGFTGKNVLFLQNGATWYDTRYNKTAAVRDGNCYITTLYGGKDESSAGIIVKSAEVESVGDIKIDELQGYVKIIFPHLRMGTYITDYPGKVDIEKATKGSFVTIITDAKEIDVNDTNQIKMVLEKLVGHVHYNAKENRDNLKGKAVIGEGLLSSRYFIEAPISYPKGRGGGIGLVDFKEMKKIKQDPNPEKDTDKLKTAFDLWKENQIKKAGDDADKKGKAEKLTIDDFINELKGNSESEEKPETDIIITDGDFETGVMKGIRSSIFSAISMYRAHSNDMLKRLGDVRLFKADTGIWAKYQGGHTDIDTKDKNNVHVQLGQKYNMLQVGFDKRINPATLVGAAFDYGTTKDTYEFGAGKGHIGGLAVYGMVTKDNGLYVDVIGKFGKMKADYDVETKEHAIYKVIGEKASGSYEAMATSLSVEVGKRIERTQGFYMEPKAELTLGYIGEHSHDVVSEKGNRMNVKQKPLLSIVGKLGLLLGRKTEKGSMFAGAMVAHEFGGNLDTVFSVGKKSKTVSMDLKDTWFELEAGGTWKTSENSYIYGTLSKNFGAFVNEKWRIDAGIRLAF